MRFEVKILGANSANPVYNRFQTAQLLLIEPYTFLIDCGEATQHQLTKYRCRINKIDHIFISHLHGDHYLGLVGLISTLHLQGRTKPLHIFGPRGLDDIIVLQLKLSETILNYELIFKEIDSTKAQVIIDLDKLTVESIPLNHRIPCAGFLFREKPKKHRIRKDVEVEHLSLAQLAMLKQGKNIEDEQGTILYNFEDYTLPPKKSRSYAFCSDTRYKPELASQLMNVDLLYHESTFTHDMLERAIQTFHTTAREAAEFANQCQAGQLIIGHFSSRYRELTPLLDEAKQYFSRTVLAIEGENYEIPEGE